MRYVNQTRLDDRIIRTDWDAGFIDGRQFGRGRSGGQVRLALDLGSRSIHRRVFLSRYATNIARTTIQAVVVSANGSILPWRCRKGVPCETQTIHVDTRGKRNLVCAFLNSP